jgi:hypothetical protein
MASGTAEIFKGMGSDPRVRLSAAGASPLQMAGGAMLMHRTSAQVNDHVGNPVNVSLPPTEKERSQDGRTRQTCGCDEKAVEPTELTVGGVIGHLGCLENISTVK